MEYVRKVNLSSVIMYQLEYSRQERNTYICESSILQKFYNIQKATIFSCLHFAKYYQTYNNWNKKSAKSETAAIEKLLHFLRLTIKKELQRSRFFAGINNTCVCMDTCTERPTLVRRSNKTWILHAKYNSLEQKHLKNRFIKK